MAELVNDVVIDPLENVYDALGLMEGQNAPALRLLVSAGAGAGLMWGIKPLVSFDASGKPLPWSVLDPTNPAATAFPWWMPAVLGGVVGGLLI